MDQPVLLGPIAMPSRPLKAMILPCPGCVPPMVPLVVDPANGLPTPMPQLTLPSGIVPVISVPILLPWITMLPVGLPSTMIPLVVPLTTLPEPEVLPPIVVLTEAPPTWMPKLSVWNAIVPVASVPIRFPWTTALLGRVPFSFVTRTP